MAKTHNILAQNFGENSAQNFGAKTCDNLAQNLRANNDDFQCTC
jgi:hypothetical protein